ncbi:MAG: chemotaxis protein CheX [Actinomycetota bacterium]|nr:chemotaxis protein CheX [Actinomycetota bacterium]
MTVTVFEPTMDDVGGIIEEVWTSFVGNDLVVVPEGAFPVPDGDHVTAVISIAGAWEGHLIIECAPEVSAGIAAAFMEVDEADVTDADVTDSLGELANMVGGFVKSLAPSPSTLSLPLVLRGNSRTSTPDSHRVCSAIAVWRDAAVTFTVYAGGHAS